MTALRSDAPLRRETSTILRGRALVLTLHPGYLEIRAKGKRRGYTVSYGAIHDLGAKIAAEAARAERLAKKKAQKKAVRRP